MTLQMMTEAVFTTLLAANYILTISILVSVAVTEYYRCRIQKIVNSNTLVLNKIKQQQETNIRRSEVWL